MNRDTLATYMVFSVILVLAFYLSIINGGNPYLQSDIEKVSFPLQFHNPLLTKWLIHDYDSLYCVYGSFINGEINVTSIQAGMGTFEGETLTKFKCEDNQATFLGTIHIHSSYECDINQEEKETLTKSKAAFMGIHCDGDELVLHPVKEGIQPITVTLGTGGVFEPQ